ncbi:LysR family transcriptional regulator [Elioraea rosea]|uniref:LysR family transcriptional regulator n=1 Tax=Elioraea rosea TaxID=2492390 RepID=UPI0011839573|nr:LysR family transcriptional regulator [Elioraea rosea]
MDRLNALTLFVAVAEEGGLAAAGRRLGLAPPSVTRVIAELEQHLGVRLFLRTTRRVTLTDAGAALLPRARAVITAMAEAEAEAAGAAITPQGMLRLTGPVTFGRMHLAGIVAAFLRAEPRVTASLLLADRVVDLVEEGLDLALRIGALPDSSLLTRKVGQTQRVLAASPSYLARRGVPDTPSALTVHDMIGFSALPDPLEWRWGRARADAVMLTPRLSVNDAGAAIAAAEAGEGIVPAFCYMLAPAIASGRLVPVLGAFSPPAVPAHLVQTAGRFPPARVSAFIGFAAPRIADAFGAYARALGPAVTPAHPSPGATRRTGG